MGNIGEECEWYGSLRGSWAGIRVLNVYFASLILAGPINAVPFCIIVQWETAAIKDKLTTCFSQPLEDTPIPR